MFNFSKVFPLLGLVIFIFLIPDFSLAKCSFQTLHPNARRDPNIVDNHFGQKVVDPYRWLEDFDSSETQTYVETTNKAAQSALERCSTWNKIDAKLKTMWNYTRYNIPSRLGDYYYTFLNSGLQRQK